MDDESSEGDLPSVIDECDALVSDAGGEVAELLSESVSLRVLCDESVSPEVEFESRPPSSCGDEEREGGPSASQATTQPRTPEMIHTRLM